MSAFTDIQAKSHNVTTYLEEAILHYASYDEEGTFLLAAEVAAEELVDYELRLDLLAKGATWEHNENLRLSDELDASRVRVAVMQEALKDLFICSSELECPVCKQSDIDDNGHAADCGLSGAMKGSAK